MEPLLCVKKEDVTIEYDVITVVGEQIKTDSRRKSILFQEQELDNRILDIEKKVSELNQEIDRLTNHADGIDYMVAVASGVISGLVDSFFVGEFSFERSNEYGTNKVNGFVIKAAQLKGYKGNDLGGAVKYLEKEYKIAADTVTNEFGGGLQHHLRDFTHHPTPVGLLFSLLSQFTGKAYGTDVHGSFRIVEITDKSFIGKNIPEKILFGTINWFFHMVSDMAGSSTSIGKNTSGTGLPGPVVSLLKEISALPIFKSTNKNGHKDFSVWISKLFNGTLIKDSNGNPLKFDMRTEIGVMHELGKQAIPVILNECIVRGFYFIRRLINELKDKRIDSFGELNRIEWQNTLPFNNRTITRMLTISTGAFTAIDIADATIRGAVKSGTNPALFAKEFILHVNFVGVGRFAIAVYSDVSMGLKKNRLENERMNTYNQLIRLYCGKIYYRHADMWISAQEAGLAIESAYIEMENAIVKFSEAMTDIGHSMDNIGKYIPLMEEKNPGLSKELIDVLKWGD